MQDRPPHLLAAGILVIAVLVMVFTAWLQKFRYQEMTEVNLTLKSGSHTGDLTGTGEISSANAAKVRVGQSVMIFRTGAPIGLAKQSEVRVSSIVPVASGQNFRVEVTLPESAVTKLAVQPGRQIEAMIVVREVRISDKLFGMYQRH